MWSRAEYLGIYLSIWLRTTFVKAAAAVTVEPCGSSSAGSAALQRYLAQWDGQNPVLPPYPGAATRGAIR